MKKTGKVLSLVLSLALVASSLTATFASAASTTGTVSVDTSTYYLSNGGSGASLKADILPLIKASDNTNFNNITLSDNSVVSSDIDAIDASVSSGSSIATLSTKKTDGVLTTASLKLTSSSVSGTVVVSVRYKGTVQMADDEDDTTIYGTQKFTFNVVKNGTIYVLCDTPVADGLMPSAIDDLSKTPGDTVTGSVYKVSYSEGSAFASFEQQPLKTEADDAGEAFVVSTAKGVNVTTNSGVSGVTTSFTLTSAYTGNGTENIGSYYAPVKGYTVTAQNYKADGTKVSSATTEKGTASVAVENRVIAYPNNDTVSSYNGVTYLYSDTITSSDDLTTAKGLTTTGAPVSKNEPTYTAAGIYGLQVVTGCDIDYSGSLTVDSGNVATVTATADTDSLAVDGGTVAEADVSKITVTGGTVTTVDSDCDELTVYGGKVGTVTATAVTVDSNQEVAATVGNITLNGNENDAVTVTSEDGYKATVGTITTAGDGAAITLSGEDVTCGQIDCQYYTTDIVLTDFKGSIAAPTHTYTDGINNTSKALTLTTTETDDNATSATVTGDAVIPTLNVESGAISFPGSLNVGSDGVSGDGSLCIVPGKFFSNGSVSGVSLKLLGTAKVGETVFTATTGEVDTNAFTPYGYTLTTTTGTKVDTFKVATTTFAGLTISGPATITQKTSATYTASAYPDGTALPTGYSVEWSIDADSDSFTTKVDGNKLTVTAGAYDDTFASINKATLTATVLDENGDETSDYDAATYDISIIKAPQYVSDTTGTYNMTVGQTYQFKITSSDGSVPPFVVANGGATVAPYTKSGNDYFFKVTGAKAGDYGVYVGGKVCVLHITGGVVCDTKAVTIASGKTYQFKVTAPSEPEFVVATVGKVALDHKVGNDYFYKVMNDGAEGQFGVYINGVRMAIITCTK